MRIVTTKVLKIGSRACRKMVRHISSQVRCWYRTSKSVPYKCIDINEIYISCSLYTFVTSRYFWMLGWVLWDQLSCVRPTIITRKIKLTTRFLCKCILQYFFKIRSVIPEISWQRGKQTPHLHMKLQHYVPGNYINQTAKWCHPEYSVQVTQPRKAYISWTEW
jgi:hypothetical protein